MASPIHVTLDGIIFGLQRFGGISNYWDRLVRHVGVAPDVASALILPRRLRFAEVDRDLYPSFARRTERIPATIARYLDVRPSVPTDVFHTSYYRVPTGRTGKYVVTVYDFTYERYMTGLTRLVQSSQKARSIRRADEVICISHATRADVLSYAPDVDPARVHVVHLGVDQGTFYADPVEADAGLSHTVLYVGQRVGYKRFDLAVDGVAGCPDLTLGIVGPELSVEEAALLDARLPGRWRSFGPVPSARLRQLYSAAFAFVFPSAYEGFGLPVLEAMACGCPVVAARTSSLPEVGGDVASYADEQDPASYAAALVRLQRSPEARRTASAAGRLRAAEFTWDRTFERTLAIYRGERGAGEPVIDLGSPP